MKNDTKEIKPEEKDLMIKLLRLEEAVTEFVGLPKDEYYFIIWLYSHDYVIGRKE